MRGSPGSGAENPDRVESNITDSVSGSGMAFVLISGINYQGDTEWGTEHSNSDSIPDMASELFKIRKWRIYINYFGILFGKYNIFNIKYQYSFRMYKSVCMGFSSFVFLQMGTIVASYKGWV